MALQRGNRAGKAREEMHASADAAIHVWNAGVSASGLDRLQIVATNAWGRHDAAVALGEQFNHLEPTSQIRRLLHSVAEANKPQ